MYPFNIVIYNYLASLFTFLKSSLFKIHSPISAFSDLTTWTFSSFFIFHVKYAFRLVSTTIRWKNVFTKNCIRWKMLFYTFVKDNIDLETFRDNFCFMRLYILYFGHQTDIFCYSVLMSFVWAISCFYLFKFNNLVLHTLL